MNNLNKIADILTSNLTIWDSKLNVYFPENDELLKNVYFTLLGSSYAYFIYPLSQQSLTMIQNQFLTALISESQAVYLLTKINDLTKVTELENVKKSAMTSDSTTSTISTPTKPQTEFKQILNNQDNGEFTNNDLGNYQNMVVNQDSESRTKFTPEMLKLISELKSLKIFQQWLKNISLPVIF